MKGIAPSQFIEALLEIQRINSISLTELKVRTFNDMVDQLSDLNIFVPFGFSDLIEFVQNFEESLSYRDFTLHIFYTDTLLNEVKKYNQIYASVDNFGEITNVWKDYVK